MRYKLVCFDVDGTLVGGLRSIWEMMHNALGIERSVVARAMQRFLDGETSFQEWAEHDINLWKERGTTRSEILDPVKKLWLMPGTMETLNALKGRGMKLAIISGGLQIVLDHLLPGYMKTFDHVMINRLLFGPEGKITGFVPVEFEFEKDEGLRMIARREGIALVDTVFVGDSDYDSEIAKAAGLSIGFNPHEKLAKVCDVIVRKKDIRDILKYIF